MTDTPKTPEKRDHHSGGWQSEDQWYEDMLGMPGNPDFYPDPHQAAVEAGTEDSTNYPIPGVEQLLDPKEMEQTDTH